MHYEYKSNDSHNLRRRKIYKLYHKDHFEPRRSDSSERRPNSPRNPRKKINFIPPTRQKSYANLPVASQTSPRIQNPSLVHNTQPPRRNRMGDCMKLPIFKGSRLEDPEQHWFLCDAM